MDPVTLTVAGLAVGVVGLAIALAQYREARRSRRLSETMRISGGMDRVPDVNSAALGTANATDITPRKVTVGCFPYPPLTTWDHGQGNVPDRFDGPWVTVVRELADRIGLEIDLRVISAPAFTDASKMDVDVVLALFKTDHRARSFDFSLPLHRIGLQGVCQASRPTISKEELAAGDLRVVVQVGEVGWEYATRELSRAIRKSNVCQVASIATYEALHMLLAGGYHLAISDEVSCLHFLREFKDHPFRLAFPRPLQIFDACLAVRKHVGWDMDQVNRHLARIRNAPPFLEAEVQALRGFEHVVERCGLV